MRGINKVILIGNLGKDPEVQVLEGNISVAKFPLATTESYKDKTGQPVSTTEWHNVVLWRGLADLAQKYLRKGSGVYIEGRLRTKHWEDKENNRHSKTEIIADNLIMLDRRKEGSEGDSGIMGSSPSPSIPSNPSQPFDPGMPDPDELAF